MNGSVVDASVAIKWFIDEPDSARAVTLLRHPIAAPDLLAPECANILWKKVGRGELRTDEAGAIALALEGAGITLSFNSSLSRHRHQHRMRSPATLLTTVSIWRLPSNCGSRWSPADMRLVNATRAEGARRFAHLVAPPSDLAAE